MNEDPTTINSYDRNLYKVLDPQSPSARLYSDPEMNQSQSLGIDPANLSSGVNTSTTQQSTGSYQQGKKLFTDTKAGYWIGVDPKDGLGKMVVGNSTTFMKWDGTSLIVAGALTFVNGSGVTTFYITPTVTAGAVGGAQDKKIKINVGGTDYYIPLNTA